MSATKKIVDGVTVRWQEDRTAQGTEPGHRSLTPELQIDEHLRERLPQLHSLASEIDTVAKQKAASIEAGTYEKPSIEEWKLFARFALGGSVPFTDTHTAIDQYDKLVSRGRPAEVHAEVLQESYESLKTLPATTDMKAEDLNRFAERGLASPWSAQDVHRTLKNSSGTTPHGVPLTRAEKKQRDTRYQKFAADVKVRHEVVADAIVEVDQALAAISATSSRILYEGQKGIFPRPRALSSLSNDELHRFRALQKESQDLQGQRQQLAYVGKAYSALTKSGVFDELEIIVHGCVGFSKPLVYWVGVDAGIGLHPRDEDTGRRSMSLIIVPYASFWSTFSGGLNVVQCAKSLLATGKPAGIGLSLTLGGLYGGHSASMNRRNAGIGISGLGWAGVNWGTRTAGFDFGYMGNVGGALAVAHPAALKLKGPIESAARKGRAAKTSIVDFGATAWEKVGKPVAESSVARGSGHVWNTVASTPWGMGVRYAVATVEETSRAVREKVEVAAMRILYGVEPSPARLDAPDESAAVESIPVEAMPAEQVPVEAASAEQGPMQLPVVYKP